MSKNERMGLFLREGGERLRERREVLRLTQAQVAERAGLTTAGYAAIERGESGPLLLSALRICLALQIRPSNVWCPAGDDNP